MGVWNLFMSLFFLISLFSKSTISFQLLSISPDFGDFAFSFSPSAIEKICCVSRASISFHVLLLTHFGEWSLLSQQVGGRTVFAVFFVNQKDIFPKRIFVHDCICINDRFKFSSSPMPCNFIIYIYWLTVRSFFFLLIFFCFFLSWRIPTFLHNDPINGCEQIQEREKMKEKKVQRSNQKS